LYVESLGLHRELSNRWGMAFTLEAFAGLAIAQQQSLRATRLFGVAEALREAINAPLPPNERENYDQNVALVRQVLGEAAFTTAWAAGRAMTLDQAMAYALRESDPFQSD